MLIINIGDNYCPDTYSIMLVVRSLLTIMFTQRSSCIGRLQVEKHESLFVQAQNVTYFVVHDMNQNDLPIYHPICLIMILAAAVLANHSSRIRI